MTISMAKEVTASSAGDNRACSNGRSGEDEYGSGERAEGRTEHRGFSETGLLCNRSG